MEYRDSPYWDERVGAAQSMLESEMRK